MPVGTNDFDKLAASWDETPGRVKVAEEVAAAILEAIPVGQDMEVLDFGCGTGLLTVRLRPGVRFITGADTSKGMLGVLKGKISALALQNVGTRLLAPGDRPDLGGPYDLIVSNMTLHHVREIAPLLEQFHAALKPGGWLCLADLDSEGGRFHEDNTGVFHHGFDRASLGDILEKAGFADVRDRTATTIAKPVAGGALESFSVFLMTGRRAGGA